MSDAINDITLNNPATDTNTLNVTTEASSATSPFTNNEDVICSFVTTGDKGADGTSGSSG